MQCLMKECTILTERRVAKPCLLTGRGGQFRLTQPSCVGEVGLPHSEMGSANADNVKTMCRGWMQTM